MLEQLKLFCGVMPGIDEEELGQLQRGGNTPHRTVRTISSLGGEQG